MERYGDDNRYCKTQLPELHQLEQLIQQGGSLLETQVLTQIEHKNCRYPIYSISMGNQTDNVPVLAFIGGVHGVERIGTQVVLAFFASLVERLKWDVTLLAALERIKLIFMPLMNPVGMLSNNRANGNGVDLMRNAPVNAEGRVPWLIGGQRLSSRLPWYRGKKNSPMQPESIALIENIKKQLLKAPFSMALDCHSGFGFYNRLWFPYAKSKRPIPHIAELYQIRKMLTETYPQQEYIFEPQSRHYTTHGDLWDHLYEKSLLSERVFIPLTLEMGSWRWLRKNPSQIFKASGIFHPIQPHRIRRVLRQHYVLMEFLIQATLSYGHWLPDIDKANCRAEAHNLWYC